MDACTGLWLRELASCDGMLAFAHQDSMGQTPLVLDLCPLECMNFKTKKNPPVPWRVEPSMLRGRCFFT